MEIFLLPGNKLVLSYLGIVLSLLGLSVVQGYIFYLLTGRKNRFIESFRLVVVAAALNRAFLVGSGYWAGSHFAKNNKISFYKALGAFVVSEFVLMLLFILIALSYSAKIAIEMPWLYVCFLPVPIGFLYYKKDKFLSLIRSVRQYIKGVINVIPFVVVCHCLNCFLFTIYYLCLFQLFGVDLRFMEVLRIVSILLTVSYLSPLPSGLGVKECTASLLLVEAGMPLGDSITVALADRVILTLFWVMLGGVFGYSIIKSEFVTRFGNVSQGIKQRLKKGGFKS